MRTLTTAHADSGVLRALLAERPWPLCLALSFALGVAWVFILLPASVILGDSPFWTFPRGIIPGGANDMGQTVVGYVAYAQAPWTLPLLQVPGMSDEPGGTNVLWLDAVPVLDVVGKIVSQASAHVVNLIGFWLLLCFSLPGVAMTVLLRVAGARSLIAVVVGTVFADTMPFLLFRWGHSALCGQFLIILALALYLHTVRRRLPLRDIVQWGALLALAITTNVYLFAMVGACWFAAIVQIWWNRQASWLRALVSSVAVVAVIVGLMRLMGYGGAEVASSGAEGFGDFSMNLVGPVFPQWSGFIPPLSSYPSLDRRSSTEGFAYLGLGLILLLLFEARSILQFIGTHWRRHLVLAVVMIGMFLFAVTNRVFVLKWLVLDVPLPNPIMQIAALFRSSGRFFWPVGYMLVALAIAVALRRFRPRTAALALSLAAVVQLVDVMPLRRAVAESASHPRPEVLDRALAQSMARGVDMIVVLPSYKCAFNATTAGEFPNTDIPRFWQANMEFQLIAARNRIRTNSVYRAHFESDCTNDKAYRQGPMQQRTLYVVLYGKTPPGGKCRNDAWPVYCRADEEGTTP